MEATAAAEKAEAYRANVGMAASRKHAKRDAVGASTSTAELERREEAMDQVLRKQRERCTKMLVRRGSVPFSFKILVIGSRLLATTSPYRR